ncbi:DUF2971 domain-containing protein [Rhizobium pisi]|uniref:DUF2971 domain-containing protein n=1 Tax=Rhizobium pisi TaxID=574561 RepID=UPI0039B11439
MAVYDYRPSSTLYHYCSAGGFEGITKNGSIWLSDLQFANDPKELQLAAIIENVMKELIRQERSPKVRVTYASMKLQLERLRCRLWMYSFSLSQRADQLPMWQEYTDRGRGLCIGFKATAFDHMSLRIQRVKYVKPEHLESLHSAVAAIAAPFIGKENDFAVMLEPMTAVLGLITTTKDDTWQHEEEVRLIFSSMSRPSLDGRVNIPVELLRDGSETYPRDPLFRSRDGMEVPYFSKQFGKYRAGRWDPNGAIDSVIIGPNNPRTVADVSDELRGKGYRGVTVTRSRCSFRP